MYFLSKTVGRLIEPIGFIWLVLLIAFPSIVTWLPDLTAVRGN
jgi:hypothetical protein